jgi:stage IV sporulation protein B
MEWKKRGVRLLFLSAALTACLVGQAAAVPQQVIVGGGTVGIRMQTEGVMITAFDDTSAAKDAGLEPGDVICAINGREVTDAQTLRVLLSECGSSATVLANRNGKQVEVLLKSDKKSDTLTLGAYVRDSIAGIGTVTFYDPETGVYGALGHGISDQSTMSLLPLQSGILVPSSVVSVVQGRAGVPGQLQGAFDLRQTIGSVVANTNQGIFGVMDQAPEGSLVPVAERGEAETGSATILCNVNGTDTVAYDVEILRLYPNSSDGRNLLLEVTDERLLAATGGIVQGMSGSPILQNGKLIGAVTHVLVSDPTRGYGIFIDNMLETAEGLEAAGFQQDAA